MTMGRLAGLLLTVLCGAAGMTQLLLFARIL
jgi:hypothetical protein